MPALSGQIISTITNGAGVPVVTVTWFYDPATFALRNNPNPWTDPTGHVWPTGSGALIAVNQLGRPVKCTVTNAATGTTKTVNLTAGGSSLTATQLANINPPNGPFTVMQDLNGLTFDLA